nr:SDR family NAD(P)-dependent oxidoreductase [Pseudenhygromyxa sp. WMMC2535]
MVTGSSSGFGLRACVALAARGFEVIASMRDLDRGEALRAALAERGFDASVELAALDVCDADQREALCARVLAERGAVDVLVNNAGVMVTGFCEDVDEASLRAQFETNFFALVGLTQALVPAMRERRWGRVINLSSAAGRRAIPGHGAYCASKFALEGWSEALRYELLPYNVFVCLIEPGMFPTQIFGRNRQVETGPDSPHARSWARLEADTAQAQRLIAPFADPQAVGERVAELAIARRPRLRHAVGPDARLAALSFGPAVETWWEQQMLRIFRS